MYGVIRTRSQLNFPNWTVTTENCFRLDFCNFKRVIQKLENFGEPKQKQVFTNKYLIQRKTQQVI